MLNARYATYLSSRGANVKLVVGATPRSYAYPLHETHPFWVTKQFASSTHVRDGSEVVGACEGVESERQDAHAVCRGSTVCGLDAALRGLLAATRGARRASSVLASSYPQIQMAKVVMLSAVQYSILEIAVGPARVLVRSGLDRALLRQKEGDLGGYSDPEANINSGTARLPGR